MLTFVGLAAACVTAAQVQGEDRSSYAPVALTEKFSEVMARMKSEKTAVMKRQMDLLQERYDLRDDPAPGVTMTRGKPVQRGIRVRLTAGTSWEGLAAMAPEEIRNGNLFPQGFLPLPHPNHPEGGMVFPGFEIDELKKQEGRDLSRFDMDFDLPDHFLPEFPAAIFLTTPPTTTMNCLTAFSIRSKSRDCGFW